MIYKAQKFIIYLFAFFVISCTGIKEKEHVFEKKFLFNDDWKFSLGDEPEAGIVDYDDHEWRLLNLPHDWSIEGEINPDNPMGNDGGYFPAGIGWYRKSFNVPSEWSDKQVSILFEGVYMNSEVFINGHSLGVYPYGYSSFFYDLTPFLLYDQENLIAVKVDNSKQKNSRWYSGSGIYRHVWLYVNNTVHIDHWGVFISTPEIIANEAKVQISTILKNTGSQAQEIILSTLLTGPNQQEVGKEKSKVDLPAGLTKELIQTITVTNPALWNPDNPELYNAVISVLQNGEIIDQENLHFGIRSIHYSAENGFQLNGEKLLLNGANVHHDHGALGAASFDRAEERKVELLKQAGFNAVRTSHNPFAPAFYDACDRLGLLVLNEVFDGWREAKTTHDYADYFDDWWERDVESFVLRDRNHPSVIMWSIGNEVLERTEPQAIETAKMLAGCVRKFDPTRPVTSGMTSWGQGWEVFDPLFAVHDIGGYNYQIHYAEFDHERVPSRIMVQTESYPRDAFYCWKMVQNHDYIIGDFVWTAMDYLGESGIGAYFYPWENAGAHWEKNLFPWHGAYCGDIDLCGFRKAISHYRNILWNDSEKLYISVREPNPDEGKIILSDWAVWPSWENWTWPGNEGKNITVDVYSKYPSVRLYLNDSIIGNKTTTVNEEFKASFHFPYQPGKLMAAGIENEQEKEIFEILTAGKVHSIELTADRKQIIANGQDLAFITVELKDEYGIHQANADNLLCIEISGPGEIVGTSNANLRDTTNYSADSINAWKGRALIIIRSKADEGTIRLTVDSEGLDSKAITIISHQ